MGCEDEIAAESSLNYQSSFACLHFFVDEMEHFLPVVNI